MTVKEKLEALRLRAGTMWREHKERAAEKRAERQAAKAQEHLHGHGRFWLLNVPIMATICAAVVEWYWALLFCIEATGHVDWNYETSIGSATPAAGLWNFAFSTHWPVFIGLVCATIPIVMLSMVWLPVQFAMRGSGRVRRGSIIAVGLLANVLVIVSGTVVMNYNRQGQVREALVVEQTADAQRAMLAANVDDLRAELDTLMNHRSTYVATAASVGAVAYERDYVAQARLSRDPRLPLLERALGSARRADELRGQIVEARRVAAQATPAAATAANVRDNVGAELNTFAQYVEVWRPPFVAVICTLIGIFGAWWVIAMLEHMNPRDVLRSGWADEGHRIEDLRDVEVVDSEGRVKTVEPMTPPREKMYDAETGEELVPRRGTWAKKPKRKGKPESVSMQPDIPPDEKGVETDGGARIATKLPGVPDISDLGTAVAPQVPNVDPQDHQANGNAAVGDGLRDDESVQVHEPSEPPELSDEQLAALGAAENIEAVEPEASQPEDQPASDDAADNEEPQDQIADHSDRPEPETREDRLLPSVAAE